MILISKKRFTKSYSKLSTKMQVKVDVVLDIFMDNPLDSRLRNHPFSGKISMLRSIDVTGDYRIRIHQLDESTYEVVELIDVGTHSKLYG